MRTMHPQMTQSSHKRQCTGSKALRTTMGDESCCFPSRRNECSQTSGGCPACVSDPHTHDELEDHEQLAPPHGDSNVTSDIESKTPVSLDEKSDNSITSIPTDIPAELDGITSPRLLRSRRISISPTACARTRVTVPPKVNADILSIQRSHIREPVENPLNTPIGAVIEELTKSGAFQPRWSDDCIEYLEYCKHQLGLPYYMAVPLHKILVRFRRQLSCLLNQCETNNDMDVIPAMHRLSRETENNVTHTESQEAMVSLLDVAFVCGRQTLVNSGTRPEKLVFLLTGKSPALAAERTDSDTWSLAVHHNVHDYKDRSDDRLTRNSSANASPVSPCTVLKLPFGTRHNGESVRPVAFAHLLAPLVDRHPVFVERHVKQEALTRSAYIANVCCRLGEHLGQERGGGILVKSLLGIPLAEAFWAASSRKLEQLPILSPAQFSKHWTMWQQSAAGVKLWEFANKEQLYYRKLNQRCHSLSSMETIVEMEMRSALVHQHIYQGMLAPFRSQLAVFATRFYKELLAALEEADPDAVQGMSEVESFMLEGYVVRLLMENVMKPVKSDFSRYFWFCVMDLDGDGRLSSGDLHECLHLTAGQRDETEARASQTEADDVCRSSSAETYASRGNAPCPLLTASEAAAKRLTDILMGVPSAAKAMQRGDPVKMSFSHVRSNGSLKLLLTLFVNCATH